MPKPVIKDIQVKRKIPNPVTKPEAISVQQVKKEDIIIESSPAKKLDSIREDNFFVPKKQKKSGGRKFLLILLIISIVLTTILYLITSVKISITPKITTVEVNESITVDSWIEPLKITVMSITEYVNDPGDPEKIESAHTEIEEKIKNRFLYDTPNDYLILDKCKTNVYYENIPEIESGNPAKISGSVSALIVEKNSLFNYLQKSLDLTNSEIKEIGRLSCELKTDITNYEIGQKSQDLSFLIKGEIKTEAIIEINDLKSKLINQTKNKAIKEIENNQDIIGHSIKIKPLNSFPLIPKNKNKITIEINSVFN